MQFVVFAACVLLFFDPFAAYGFILGMTLARAVYLAVRRGSIWP